MILRRIRMESPGTYVQIENKQEAEEHKSLGQMNSVQVGHMSHSWNTLS